MSASLPGNMETDLDKSDMTMPDKPDMTTRKTFIPIFPPGVVKKEQLGIYSKFAAADFYKEKPQPGSSREPDRFTFSLHQDGGNSDIENPNNIPCRDFFFESDKVWSLNGNNFTTFLTRKDATLVMFYNDRFPDSHTFQKLFSEAAGNTKRENHAFAAVDCNANPKLCSGNGVCKVPIMRLYSKNFCIGELKTVKGLSAEILRQYVEMAPLSDCSRMVSCTRL